MSYAFNTSANTETNASAHRMLHRALHEEPAAWDDRRVRKSPYTFPNPFPLQNSYPIGCSPVSAPFGAQ